MDAKAVPLDDIGEAVQQIISDLQDEHPSLEALPENESGLPIRLYDADLKIKMGDLYPTSMKRPAGSEPKEPDMTKIEDRGEQESVTRQYKDAKDAYDTRSEAAAKPGFSLINIRKKGDVYVLSERYDFGRFVATAEFPNPKIKSVAQNFSETIGATVQHAPADPARPYMWSFMTRSTEFPTLDAARTEAVKNVKAYASLRLS